VSLRGCRESNASPRRNDQLAQSRGLVSRLMPASDSLRMRCCYGTDIWSLIELLVRASAFLGPLLQCRGHWREGGTVHHLSPYEFCPHIRDCA
jgi:hypothetical protein